MKSPFTQTVQEESPGTGLAVPGMPSIDNPAEVFKPGGSKGFLQRLRLFIREQDLDISTDVGKDFVRSFAYRLVTTRTDGVRQADKLIEDDKKHIADVTSERKYFETELKKMWHEVRGPLTEFENRDKERTGAHEMALGQIFDACMFIGTPSVQGIKDRLAMLATFEQRKWEEFEARATSALAQSKPSLEAMLAKAEKAEADRLELEESRRKIAEFEAAERKRKQQEREDQIAREATERAEKAAQQKQEEEAKPKKLWTPGSYERVAAAPVKETAPMAQQPVKTEESPISISGWAIPKPDGEAIPPREEKIAAFDGAAERAEIESVIFDDLTEIVDMDQAQDILDAIKAGKIRHVKIEY